VYIQVIYVVCSAKLQCERGCVGRVRYALYWGVAESLGKKQLVPSCGKILSLCGSVAVMPDLSPSE
jgi:hypothetical protein